jgi:hypothetical protein
MEARCVSFDKGTEFVNFICMRQMNDGQDDNKERWVESTYFLFISALYYSISIIGRQVNSCVGFNAHSKSLSEI